MEAIGFTKFPGLMAKFKNAPHKEEDIEMLTSIKQSMENMVYLTETSNGMSKKELAAQYNDRDFICEEGTLTNLQGIMAGMSLGRD